MFKMIIHSFIHSFISFQGERARYVCEKVWGRRFVGGDIDCGGGPLRSREGVGDNESRVTITNIEREEMWR